MKALVTALALFSSACAPARPGIPPRHLLLVTCESMRADHGGMYMARPPTTSLAATEVERREFRAMGLDHLASSGVVFATCTSPSPRVVPALASLFTGVSPRSARVETNAARIPSDVPTLAELCADSGFRTGAFATIVPGRDLEASLGRGFEEFRSSADDSATLAAALEWSKRDPGDGSRRFTWIHLAGPVPPFDHGATTSDVEELLAAKDFGPALEGDELASLAAGTLELDPGTRARLENTYDRALARTSLALSRLLEDAFDYTRPDADASETWARTVLVFTAPSGILLGEEGLVGNPDRVHEGLTRVPLVVRHPDSLTGERVIAPVVELADLLPTLVEWFDLATPARVEGRSLLALLDSYVERPFERRPTVSRAGEACVGVRDERWHLVVERSGDGWHPCLYEPARDPAERDDLARSHPDVVRRLLASAGLAPPSPE